tara:strand:+ start:540 stop:1421 length:882 start_codon:yes stop_codon:yes gene_type:complete
MCQIQSFLDYLSLEKRYSYNTIKSYQTDLKLFESFLKNTYDISIEKTDQNMTRSWLVNEIKKGNSSRTVNRKITTLKSFFKFLVKIGEITQNPTLKITSSKTTKKIPQFVGLEDMNRILDNIKFKKNFSGFRDKLIVEIFYSTGMRLSELINIKINDFDVSKGVIKVLGKRNKERFIPLTKELQKSLDNYLVFRAKHLQINHSYLLVTDLGKKLNPSMVYRKVNDILNRVTTLEKKSPHILRHTFATHMLNNGADLNVIKELLGHASLSATEVYTHNSIEQLKKVFNRSHPRA